ncbi:exostosin family protein [Marinilabilia salmonicolor]|uniref:Exostosin family protein n=1 Tax=Marinilabilia salmonicolor TaxID=989 RepID=A0A368V6K2_9BACT|nr:exostosin family protein [Marinilabilia salmonicolor]RCW36719.1 exostosin family protein [Marinilabilia salmonicolor]
MKVYIGNISRVFSKPKKELVDFLFPFYNMNQKKETVSSFSQGYELVEMVDDADFCLLPFPWNYYYTNKCKDEALQFIDDCHKAHKEVVTFTSGDFGVPPLVKDVIVIRQSGYHSQRLDKQYALPAFVNDPVERFFEGDVQFRKKQDKPVVGFCGQGTSSPFRYAGVFVSNIFRNLKYYLGVSYYEPQDLYPSTLRRNKVLSFFEKSSLTETDFIIRQKYRGGAVTEEQRRSTALEFYKNMRDTDYTLCLRGVGNFSVRIYETLAMGRIPVFVNTDCILPFDQFIDWKSHVVWIDQKDISKADEILSEFHLSIHPDDFTGLQAANRELWEKYLSMDGFYSNLPKLINTDSQHKLVI